LKCKLYTIITKYNNKAKTKNYELKFSKLSVISVTISVAAIKV